ncbi:hypothetical protein ACROYT_G004215 [Oculina patagonica]
MKSESSCGALCQHPECWRANLQRVKDAVRLRNGIHSSESVKEQDFDALAKSRKNDDEGSLPTLKVVDVFGETDLRQNSAPINGRSSSQSNRYHHRSSSLPSLSPDLSHRQSLSCTPTVRVPRPSPVSPTMLTDYQKRMLWKKKLQSVADPADSPHCEEGKASIVGVHEMYENDELLQDWKDVYITSAYLIWCQTNRRKKRKAKSTGSITNRKDPRRIAFKDVTEDMIPAAMEKTKPKRPEPRRSPTVGLPYSPSRASSHRRVHVQHLDLSKYGLEDFGDFPKSVIAGILQHLKPSTTDDQELPLGLEAQPKQQSSPRAEVLSDGKPVKTDLGKKVNIAEPGKQTLEQTLHDENSRMLLDIDINSHFTPPVEEEVTDEEGGDGILGNSKQGTKLELNMIKEVSDKLTAKQGRALLPLSSVGVPSDQQSKARLHHCMNSIPRNLDLGVAMEPVDVVSVTPTPTGTPREEVAAQDSQLCALGDSSLDVTLGASELISPSDEHMNQYWPVRGHMTSALRYSPTPVHAPAPTPISPDRYGQYSRTPYAREHSTSVTSRHIRRWETLSSVDDQDETVMSREALGSPEGEGDEVAVEPVFLTEEVLSRDPNLTPLSNRKDVEEWPHDRMIINIIENDVPPRTGRSPSPGSKTYIPHDILAEFHGDLYGRKEMRIAGQKMTGKLNVVKEPEISTDLPGYIAPAWRPPRSRTPIQFLETPSRRAPKPLRQPPAESVPKSLTVQSLARRVLRRPKSTPPRISSPRDSRDLPVQQILSDSSLAPSLTRDDMETYSMVAQVSSPSADICGSIPPPPSPEALLVAPVVPSAPRLDPVSEVEEKSSIASCSVADGTSQVEGGNAVANLSEVEESGNAVANLSEVEEADEDVDLSQQPQNADHGSSEEKEEGTDLKVIEETETAKPEQSKEVEENHNSHEQTVSLTVDGDSVPMNDENNLPTAGTGSDEITENQTEHNEDESEKQQDENPKLDNEVNSTADESLDKEPIEEAVDPPHPLAHQMLSALLISPKEWT